MTCISNSYRQHRCYVITKHFSRQSFWTILFLNTIPTCDLSHFYHWCFKVIYKGRNRHFLAHHPCWSMNFKFQNYIKTTIKMSCECKLISFSSVIHIVGCTTATYPVLCALPSMLGCNLQFSFWKSDLPFMVSRSRSENVLISTTLQKVRIQL